MLISIIAATSPPRSKFFHPPPPSKSNATIIYHPPTPRPPSPHHLQMALPKNPYHPSTSVAIVGNHPLTPKASLIRYWKTDLKRLAQTMFLLNKASLSTAVQSATFFKLDDQTAANFEIYQQFLLISIITTPAMVVASTSTTTSTDTFLYLSPFFSF